MLKVQILQVEQVKTEEFNFQRNKSNEKQWQQ